MALKDALLKAKAKRGAEEPGEAASVITIEGRGKQRAQSARRQRHRTSRVLLKVGLVLLVLAVVSIVVLLQLSNIRPPSIALLLAGWAALGLTVAATLCLLYSLAFWADKRWHIFSRWVWPRR